MAHIQGEELDVLVSVEHAVVSNEPDAITLRGMQQALQLIRQEPTYPRLLTAAVEQASVIPQNGANEVDHMRQRGMYLMAARLGDRGAIPHGLLAAVGPAEEAAWALETGFSEVKIGVWVMRSTAVARGFYPVLPNEADRTLVRRALYEGAFSDVHSEEWQEDDPEAHFGIPVNADTVITPVAPGTEDIALPFVYAALDTALATARNITPWV